MEDKIFLEPGYKLFVHPETHETDVISDFNADIQIRQAQAGGYIEMENGFYVEPFDDPEYEETVAVDNGMLVNTGKLFADLQGKSREEAIKIINPNYVEDED